jgi:hypothetical protein
MGRLRFIQDRETGELIPADDYRPKAPRSAAVVPDIEPYRVPGTNEWHTSRSHRREYMRREGVQEVGNEKPKWMRERDYADRHR